MQSNIYVSLSGQIALLKRLETVAQNVANTASAGYRAERVSFAEILSPNTDKQVSYAGKGQSYISTESGPLEHTGNPLDIAVRGDAWLGISTPGGIAYSRDGRLRMTAEGNLETIGGYALVDVGGAPIQLNPDGGHPTISKEGAVSQGSTVVGTIGLFQIPNGAGLTRSRDGSVKPDQPARPQIDFSSAGVVQGFIERSNVDPVGEMTRLITIQRTFDSIANAVSDVENGLDEAIRSMGS